MTDPGPVVSAVIPTRNRAHLVERAVLSALNQTIHDLEVIVVVDGPDPQTVLALQRINDDRLRIVEAPSCLGGAGARNLGVGLARGQWIGFLDDDDEWLPAKTEKQLAMAVLSPYELPIISCRMSARTSYGDYVWPSRLPDEAEPISEYILARKSLLQSGGMITTSTLLIPRKLLLRVPFRAAQKKHQDWDWILHAVSVQGAHLAMAADVLTIYNAEETHFAMSSGNDWRYSCKWIEEIRPIITSRAYAAFLLSSVAAVAVRAGERRGCIPLLRQALSHGTPAATDLIVFSGILLLPQSCRRQLRRLLSWCGI